MKANELRIGNLIEVAQIGDVHKVIKILGDNIQCELHDIGHSVSYIGLLSEYKPIPLTEEWFKKFGFSLDDIGYWCKEDSIYSFVDRGDLGYMLVIADNEFKETYLKYIHTLQNCWFALTGEELTIKG